MTVNAHIFPSLNLMLNVASNAVVGTTALNAALMASGNTTANCLGGASNAGLPNATIEAMTTWTSIKANGSNACAEVASGGGYTTGGLSLTAADLAIADSGTSTPWTTITYSGTIQWTAATFTAYQAVFYFNGTTTQGICYWDFGGAQSCSSGTFTLTLGTANSVANALVQYTTN
jgi:hypothetical protein